MRPPKNTATECWTRSEPHARIRRQHSKNYRLAESTRATGLPIPVITRFVNRQRDLKLASADKLATYFGLRLFGPDAETPTGNETSLSERLRLVIHQSGQTLQAIQLESGVRTDALVRFLAGEQDLLLVTADKLARHFGLTLVDSPEPALTPVGAI